MLSLILFAIVWYVVGIFCNYILDCVGTFPVTIDELILNSCLGPFMIISIIGETAWGRKPAFRKKND